MQTSRMLPLIMVVLGVVALGLVPLLAQDEAPPV